MTQSILVVRDKRASAAVADMVYVAAGKACRLRPVLLIVVRERVSYAGHMLFAAVRAFQYCESRPDTCGLFAVLCKGMFSFRADLDL